MLSSSWVLAVGDLLQARSTMCLVFGLFTLLCSIYFTSVAGDATFINPPPYPKSGFNLATSPSYELGSVIDIKWTIQPRSNVSLMLFQLKGTTSLSPFEKIFSNLDADVTSFRWTVQTKKDLAFSNNFWMCLFPEHENIAAGCTDFFNITGIGAGPQVPVSTSSGSDTQATRSITSISTAAAPATITADGMVPVPITTSEPMIPPVYSASSSSSSTLTATPTNTPTSTSAPKNSGLSTAAKAGIGVGLFAGAIVIGAGLFLAYLRWKKWRETPVETNSITRFRIFGASTSTMSFYHDNRSRSTNIPEFVSGWT